MNVCFYWEQGRDLTEGFGGTYRPVKRLSGEGTP